VLIDEAGLPVALARLSGDVIEEPAEAPAELANGAEAPEEPPAAAEPAPTDL
jgi:hypothetical protein